jgi:hypothetical protein
MIMAGPLSTRVPFFNVEEVSIVPDVMNKELFM